MTKISSYAAVTPTGTDLLIGTDTSASDATKNFTIDSIGQYFSLQTSYINYYDYSSPETTTISLSNTWYKLNSTTTEGYSQDGLTHTNNRVTYGGATTKVFSATGIATVSGSNNDNIHFAFFKNGVLLPESEQDVTLSSGGKGAATPIQTLIQMSTNDYVEVWVKNSSGARNVTLDHLNVVISQV